MKSKTKIIVLLSLFIAESWAGEVLAGQYAVQLEATQKPRLAHFSDLGVYGQLYTETATNGLIRTRLGPFQSRAKAQKVLLDVHNAGYTGAIITPQVSTGTAGLGRSKTQAQVRKQSQHRYDIESFDVKTLDEWKRLSPEQQKNLVYLDGALHVKVGNDFIPLNEVVK